MHEFVLPLLKNTAMWLRESNYLQFELDDKLGAANAVIDWRFTKLTLLAFGNFFKNYDHIINLLKQTSTPKLAKDMCSPACISCSHLEDMLGVLKVAEHIGQRQDMCSTPVLVFAAVLRDMLGILKVAEQIGQC